MMGDEFDYEAHVLSIATDVATECEMALWCAENDGSPFYDFVDEKEYDGQIMSIIDATCDLGNYKDAIRVLEATGQDPDHVDCGLYEGADWKRTLIIIAFEVTRMDVMEKLEEFFDSKEFPAGVVAYPTNNSQIGFFPANKTFHIPEQQGFTVDLSDGVKILIVRNMKTLFSVVFEGDVDYVDGGFEVDCRRIYNQTEGNIDDDFRRCQVEFGVREV